MHYRYRRKIPAKQKISTKSIKDFRGMADKIDIGVMAGFSPENLQRIKEDAIWM